MPIIDQVRCCPRFTPGSLRWIGVVKPVPGARRVKNWHLCGYVGLNVGFSLKLKILAQESQAKRASLKSDV